MSIPLFPIPLFPIASNPPLSPQHGFDDIYYFPPCRIHESTPDPITSTSPANSPRESPCHIHESTPDPIAPSANLRKLSRLRRKRRSSPSESVHRSQLPRALGAKNILNQVKVVPKLALKRRSKHVDNDRPSKRQHLWDNDMKWLEREIDGIKERMMQMENKLDAILHEVR